MTVRTFLLGVFVAASLLPSRAIAQDRAGFWFGVGGGFGSAGVSCDDCGESNREGSGVAYFKGGWTINRQTLVGAEFNYWSKNDTTVSGQRLWKLRREAHASCCVFATKKYTRRTVRHRSFSAI
jgi:hypothetical protein